MLINLILWFLLSQLLLGIYLWLKVRHLYKYPNLFGSPIFGNLYYFYRHLMIISHDSHYKYYEKVSEELGCDMFFAFSYGRLTVILSCPHLVKALAYNPHASNKPEIFTSVNGSTKGMFSYAASDSEWKTRRKEANQALKKSQIQGPFHGIFIKCGKEIIDEIEAEPKAADIHYSIYTSFLNNVKATIFGMDHFEKADRSVVNDMILANDLGSNAINNIIYGFIFYYLSKIVMPFLVNKAFAQRNEMIDHAIEKSKEILKDQQSQDDKFRLPLSVAIATRNAQLSRPKTELEKELTELPLAAWHTSSMTMSGVATYLAIFQEMQQKVWDEQVQIFGDSDRDPTPDDLNGMVYLERFLKETLRFLGPTTLTKLVTKDMDLGGVTIPVGFSVEILLHKMRKDPRFWKHPEVFNPDRFVDEIEHVPTYAYAPFGVGIRNCPGMTYAFSLLKIVTSTIIRKYKLSTDAKFEDLNYHMDFINRVNNPPSIRFEKRK